MEKLKKLLQFMQSQDKNGSWLEWYGEISRNESAFDPAYVQEVLQNWYEDSQDPLYLGWKVYAEH